MPKKPAARKRSTAPERGRSSKGAAAPRRASAAKPRHVRDIPDPKKIGRGPNRMSPVQKQSLLRTLAPHHKLKIVKDFWVDPRAPHIPSRIQVRISDPSWYFTDDPPSIGLSPYGGNSGGADIRLFFKPTFGNRPHLVVFYLTVLHTNAVVRTSAPGSQQQTFLGKGPATVAFLFTPAVGWQTILLGIDGASAANRIALHGCEITVLE